MRFPVKKKKMLIDISSCDTSIVWPPWPRDKSSIERPNEITPMNVLAGDGVGGSLFDWGTHLVSPAAFIVCSYTGMKRNLRPSLHIIAIYPEGGRHETKGGQGKSNPGGGGMYISILEFSYPFMFIA